MPVVRHRVGKTVPERPSKPIVIVVTLAPLIVERPMPHGGERLSRPFLDRELTDVGHGAMPIAVPTRAPLRRIIAQLIDLAVYEAHSGTVNHVATKPIQSCG